VLDPVDRKLLGLLQQDAQAKYAELGAALNLSPPAVFDRVKKLKRAGALKRYTVEVAPEATGFGICAFVSVTTTGRTCAEVIPDLEHYPEIEECHSIAGQECLLLKVRTSTPKELETLLSSLWHVPGIVRTATTLVLDTYIARGTRIA
jgi:DNA-binding Lrp family transcriptional regulator